MRLKLVFALSALLCSGTLCVSASAAAAADEPESKSWYERAKVKAASLTNEQSDTIADMLEILDQSADSARAFSAQTLEAALEALSGKSDAIREAGFETTQLYLDLGLIPGAIVVFEQAERLSEARRMALLETYADDSLVSFVLKTLYRAFDTRVSGFEVSAVRIHLSATPRVTAVLKKVRPD